MLKPNGYSTIIDPTAKQLVTEADNVTCIHCGRIDMVKSKLSGNLEVMVFRDDGTHYFKEAGFCRRCYAPICPLCVGKPCSNRHMRMEEEEEAEVRKFICI